MIDISECARHRSAEISHDTIAGLRLLRHRRRFFFLAKASNIVFMIVQSRYAFIVRGR